MKKEPKIWHHWNKEKELFRYWLYIFQFVFNLEISTKREKSFGIDTELDFDETNGLKIGIFLGFTTIFFIFENILPRKFSSKMLLEKEIISFTIFEVKIFENSFMYGFLSPCYFLQIRGTKRKGLIFIDDLVFGKPKITVKNEPSKEIGVYIPDDKWYKGTITKSIITHKRPRKKTQHFPRIELEIEEGVPVPGKGTTSYNCEDGCTYSLSIPGTNEQEVINQFANESKWQ